MSCGERETKFPVRGCLLRPQPNKPAHKTSLWSTLGVRVPGWASVSPSYSACLGEEPELAEWPMTQKASASLPRGPAGVKAPDERPHVLRPRGGAWRQGRGRALVSPQTIPAPRPRFPFSRSTWNNRCAGRQGLGVLRARLGAALQIYEATQGAFSGHGQLAAGSLSHCALRGGVPGGTPGHAGRRSKACPDGGSGARSHLGSPKKALGEAGRGEW